jgi:hypothetical protein
LIAQEGFGVLKGVMGKRFILLVAALFIATISMVLTATPAAAGHMSEPHPDPGIWGHSEFFEGDRVLFP